MQHRQPSRLQTWTRALSGLALAAGLITGAPPTHAEAFYSVGTTVEIELGGVPLDSGLIRVIDYWEDGFENFNGQDPPAFPSYVTPERTASGDAATASASFFAASTGAARYTSGPDAAAVSGRTASGGGFTLVNESDFGFFVDVTVRGFFETTTSVDEGASEYAETHAMLQFVGDNLNGMPEDGLIGFYNTAVRPRHTAASGPIFLQSQTSSQILGFQETYSILIPPTFQVNGSEVMIHPVSLGVAGVAQGQAISLYRDEDNFIVYEVDDPRPAYTLLAKDEIGPPIPEPGAAVLLVVGLALTARRGGNGATMR